jgi:hypothetical protein
VPGLLLAPRAWDVEFSSFCSHSQDRTLQALGQFLVGHRSETRTPTQGHRGGLHELSRMFRVEILIPNMKTDCSFLRSSFVKISEIRVIRWPARTRRARARRGRSVVKYVLLRSLRSLWQNQRFAWFGYFAVNAPFPFFVASVVRVRHWVQTLWPCANTLLRG